MAWPGRKPINKTNRLSLLDHPMNRFVIPVVTAFVLAGRLTIASPIPEDAKIAGFGVGSQAYTFNRFSVFEAIEKTAQAGGKLIEFFPGQKLSIEEPNVKWDHNSPDEVMQKVKDQLAKFKIRAVN